jgi:hypothetical protein
MESPLVELPVCQPDAMAVMHKYLDSRATSVGKQVSVSEAHVFTPAVMT